MSHIVLPWLDSSCLVLSYLVLSCLVLSIFEHRPEQHGSMNAHNKCGEHDTRVVVVFIAGITSILAIGILVAPDVNEHVVLAVTNG